ncbi:23S rRNA (uracil(1939)-C(5))-methyltransferase RlmD [Roseivirga sp. UBA1976]|uniref:23S rRNA (uracil(1939)-C(5))-methyltransferase RlmD n=1 Tax=Roseivirga sp. UBA1976 TaxID=1947386 RepID=UPI00257F5988|nr:23S rRNA (uracil(1939)-C(5))-methyltransferase RlmD [Roseivirga sp. UBA1976]|tara:strand:+ start:19806 stop:21212 length:1407 start_codon:yes stop_codon:yes gene_type:complete
MAKYRGKKKIIEQVEVQGIAAEGKCIAKVDEQVIFIEKVAPGDVVDVLITRKKPNFMEGTPVHFHSFSPDRVDPFCEHFGTCGGCKWQHIPYPIQLKYKHQQVVDNLQRIAKVELPEIHPILGSSKTRHYRNKLEYTFTNWKWLTQDEIESDRAIDRRALGFHIPGRFDKILQIKNCYHQPEPSNQIRLAAEKFCKENDIQFYDLVKKTGNVRNLIIRNSVKNEWMVIVQFACEDEKNAQLLDFLKNEFPEITSLQYVINNKPNETFHDLPVEVHHGHDYIMEEMEGIQFKVGPKSFYQTNALQAYELYKVARDFAGLTGQEVVYDLYTGTGTIANFVAKKAKKVIGIEYVEAAIEDAKINSEINGIDNTLFYAGDMKDILNDAFIAAHEKPDVIITDPPRAGMHQDVVDMLLKIEARKIVYVSCNPATQARDIGLLDAKYKLSQVQPVDMFPQTHHVENVVLLELRN